MPGYPPISEDLSELIALLNSHGVDFLVVGAHALAFHGLPRFTEDIDFFLSRRRENIERLASALKEFGLEVSRLSQDEMVSKDRGVIFIGHKPNRADFLNFLDGVNFEEAAESKVAGELAGQPVFFISLQDYVATKRASGRPKDLGDLAMLSATHPEING